MIYAQDVEGEFVLLVEDDVMLLATTQSVLAAHGYKVAACSTPEEAITICTEHPRARVVLTEVAFPGSQLGGMHVAQYARGACCAATVLTFHRDPALLFGLPGFDEYPFLPQPYTPGQVLAEVAEAWSSARRIPRGPEP